MKTFDGEFEELKKWMDMKTEKFIQEMEKEPLGLDSLTEYQRYLDVKEYNRKLKALKEKYHIKDLGEYNGNG
jgi:hypothetical protein